LVAILYNATLMYSLFPNQIFQ